MSDASGKHSGQTFRSPFAVVIWWLWVLFAVANLIDLAVQGRDHVSVVAAFTLLLVTGVVYTTAQRPRVVADDTGMTIVNPLREHRAGWGAVAGIDSAGLLRVRCEWPLGGGTDTQKMGKRAIYAWAVQPQRRRQAAAQLRADRRPRVRSSARTGGPFGMPVPPDTSDQPPTAGEAEQMVTVLTALAEQSRAATAGPPPEPPVSTWYWPAFAAIIVPALALVIAILS